MANKFINVELFQAGLDEKLGETRNLLQLVESESVENVQVGQINLVGNKYIGDATKVAPGKEIPVSNMEQTETPVNFHKIAKGVRVLDEEANSGFGDVIGNAQNQTVMAIDGYMDQEVADLLKAATQFTVTGEANHETIIDAIAMMGDSFTNSKNYLAVSPATYGEMQKSFAKVGQSLQLENNPFGVEIILSSRVGDTVYLVQEGAIKEYISKDTHVEDDRDASTKSTYVFTDKIYGVQLYDESKVVAIKPVVAGS